MRVLILPLLLVACAEDAGYSQAPLARTEIERKADAAGDVSYICSHTGEEAAMWTLRSGEQLDPIPTGRSCDYEAYKAWREGHGPEPERQYEPMMHFHEWREREV